MKRTILPLAVNAALVGLVFSSTSRRGSCTDFDVNPGQQKLLNVSGLDANSEHGGGSGGAPAVVEKAILNSDGAAVAKAMIFVGTGEEGYHARNLAQAAAKLWQRQSAIPDGNGIRVDEAQPTIGAPARGQLPPTR